MYQEILLPTDGTAATEAVLDHTLEVASGRDATVHVLYVVDDQAFLTLSEDEKQDVLDGLRDEGEAAIEDTVARLEAAGLDTRSEISRGKPAEEIIAYVDLAGIDLVTMATHGDSHEQNMLGSTAENVVSSAAAPVLTVAIGDE